MNSFRILKKKLYKSVPEETDFFIYLFQNLGYSIHFTLLFMHNWMESHTVHSCWFQITLSTMTVAVWTLCSVALVLLYSFHIQHCLFFLVRLVIFRWNIIARVFSVLWEFHNHSQCLFQTTSALCLLVPLRSDPRV